LRNLSAHAHLIVKNPTSAAATGEHLHLVGDARSRRVDEVQQRTQQIFRGLLDAENLFDRARAPRASLDGRVVRHDRDHPPVDRAGAGDDAVGGQIFVEVVREPSVFHEAVFIEQEADSLAGEELLLLGVFLVILGSAALENALLDFVVLVGRSHGRPVCTKPATRREPPRSINQFT
jgi:hypothetical protein